VFEKRNSLYFYPTYYELSSAPRTSSTPAPFRTSSSPTFIPWIIKTLGKKKFFIVGRTTSIARDGQVSKILIEKNGGEWIADEYLELGHSEWGSMVTDQDLGLHVVLSNVVGDSVVAFYREFRTRADAR